MFFADEASEVTEYPAGLLEQGPTGGQVEVSLGGDVHLQCPGGGCWARAGGGLAPADGPSLAMDRVVYQQAGEYRCLAAPAHHRDDPLAPWRTLLHVTVRVTGKYLFVLSQFK